MKSKIKNYIIAIAFLLICFAFMAGTLYNTYKNKGDFTENSFQSNITLKTKMIDINGAFQRIINKNYIDDVNPDYSVVKLQNGYLSWAYKSADMTSQINDTITFNSFLKDNKINFLMLQMPFKISKYDDELPSGVYDYSNETADKFLAGINEHDVDILDLRDEIKNQGINHYELFFKTDHHWKPEAALWAAKTTVSYLDDKKLFNEDASIYNNDNYNYKVYTDWFLGSQGKRIGTLYNGTDDISLITPKFPTNFTFKLPHKSIEKTGEFKDVMFDYSLIETKDLFNLNPYAAYTGGDFPLNIITNNENTNGKNVLLIRDSFSCTFAPFLSLSTKSLHIVDLRYYKDNLKDYILNNNIDLVIMAYNPSAYLNSTEKFNLLNK